MAALIAFLKCFAAAAAVAETGASFGTTIPRPAVAATEDILVEGKYEAAPASAYPEGTPVDVVADHTTTVAAKDEAPRLF